MCQQFSLIPETPDSPILASRGDNDYFDLLFCLTIQHQRLINPLANGSTVVENLQKMSLHVHFENNAYVTGCLACGKSSDRVLYGTVADYFRQRAQPGDSVRVRLM